jgi:hypothetical protein
LRAASGKLEHVFSIKFGADPVTLAKVKGLVSLTLAQVSDGQAIKIVLDDGVPYPTRAISVRVVTAAGVDADRLVDPLRRPSAMPSPAGQRLISTFRVPGRNSYIAAWHDMRSGKSSLTFWDEDKKVGELIPVATTSSRILGAAVQPSMHASPKITIVVWTRGSGAGDVVAGMYGWTGPGD